jgi:hypothetical protein
MGAQRDEWAGKQARGPVEPTHPRRKRLMATVAELWLGGGITFEGRFAFEMYSRFPAASQTRWVPQT